jgi:hypothetical protein
VVHQLLDMLKDAPGVRREDQGFEVVAGLEARPLQGRLLQRQMSWRRRGASRCYLGV